MKSMRWRLIVILALILLFFQTISMLWLWHESREQIDFLVNKALNSLTHSRDKAHLKNEIREAAASLVIPSTVMVTCMLFCSFLAVGWITRPLKQLRLNLQQRSANNLEPLPIHSSMAEVKAITLTLNQLFQRLNSTLQEERLFTADAAHELRTPLAGVKLHLELMQTSGSISQTAMLVERIDRLMHTIEQLLMLARAGQALAGGHYKILSWQTDIIQPLQAEMEELGMQKQQRILWPSAQPLPVEGDALLLRLMLRNLLENACRYSPENSDITVTLAQENQGTLLSVSDRGPGIDWQHRKVITEPFRRLDRRYNGSGLGLNIVLRILRLHHGKLSLEDNPDKQGLLAQCWLPQASGSVVSHSHI